jgi:hypothetical protein
MALQVSPEEAEKLLWTLRSEGWKVFEKIVLAEKEAALNKWLRDTTSSEESLSLKGKVQAIVLILERPELIVQEALKSATEQGTEE